MVQIFNRYAIITLLALALAGCAKEKKKEEMQMQELSKKAFAYLEKKKYDDATVYLEELVGRFPDNPNIAKYKTVLAETYFKDGKYAAAQEVYERLNQFYPADPQAEFNKYRSILSMFYQTLRSECDQTETEETTKLCKEYLQNTAYKNYRKDVIDIQNTCENRLIDKDVYVFNFYLRKHNYDAAHIRLKNLKDKHLVNNPALEAQLLYLECKLAQKEKNPDLLKQDIDKLNNQFPESQFTQMAQALVSKNNRFLF